MRFFSVAVGLSPRVAYVPHGLLAGRFGWGTLTGKRVLFRDGAWRRFLGGGFWLFCLAIAAFLSLGHVVSFWVMPAISRVLARRLDREMGC
jgi:hypothetical protein